MGWVYVFVVSSCGIKSPWAQLTDSLLPLRITSWSHLTMRRNARACLPGSCKPHHQARWPVVSNFNSATLLLSCRDSLCLLTPPKRWSAVPNKGDSADHLSSTSYSVRRNVWSFSDRMFLSRKRSCLFSCLTQLFLHAYHTFSTGATIFCPFCVMWYICIRMWNPADILQVACVGQIVCAVVADSAAQAKQATSRVKITYKALEPVVLTIEVIFCG